VKRGRVWLLVGGLLVLTGAVASSVFFAAGGGRADLSASAIAVVLVPDLAGSELVSVELDSGDVVGRVRLRSLATDIEADAAGSRVIAAQTGGIAGAADDALGIADPRTGLVDYVTLPTIDPSQVECVRGAAAVLHAVIRDDGFVVSSVDLASRTASDAGRIPDGTGLWAAASGSLWTAVATDGAVPYSLLRIDPGTLATQPGPAIGFEPWAVTGAGDRTIVLGGVSGGGDGSGRVALLDEKTTAVTATAAVPGLPNGARLATVIGDRLVVGDWNGEAPESTSLQVLELSTLRSLKAIEVGGAPCALASYHASLLVVDRVSGALLRIDPISGDVRWRTALGATDLVCSKIVVLPAQPD